MDLATSPGIGLDDIPSAIPPTGVQPDFTSPATLGTPIRVVSAITSALTITLLLIRLYSTVRITRTAWYDDIAIVVGAILSLAYSSNVINKSGFARHGWDLPVSAFTADFSKDLLVESILAPLSLLVSKLCTLLLFYRLFGSTKRFRYCVYFGVVWIIVLTGTTVVSVVVMCAPHSGESFADVQVPMRCSRLAVYSVVHGSLNAVLDIYLLYLPLPVIWKLQLERTKKFGIAAIFMTGLIACFASILGLVVKVQLLSTSDVLWNSFKVQLFTIVEINASIMVACMPACASWFRFLSDRTDCFRRLGVRISETGFRLIVLGKKLGPRPYADSHELSEDTEMAVRYVGSDGQLQRPPSNTTPSTANLSLDDHGQHGSPQNKHMEC